MRQSFIVMSKALVTFFLSSVFLTSCVPDTTEKKIDIKIIYSDTEIQHIYNLQDSLDMKGLYPYIKSDNPTHRYMAAMAMASIQNNECIDTLSTLLKDPVMEVRAAAAYAIGQIGDEKTAARLILSFRNKDTVDVNNMFNCHVLEAVGKTGNIKDLVQISTVKTYRSDDTLLLLGQARAIYRMALRNIVTPEGTSRMVDLLHSAQSPHEVKLYAAHYLARAKNLDVSLLNIRLSEVFNREKHPDIRMSLATCFGNNTDSLFLPALKSRLSREEDYRVQTQIIRALSQYRYADIRDALIPYLKHENIHVASTAAQAFQRNGIPEDVAFYQSYDNDSIPWQVRAPMNGAVLAHTPLYYTRSKNAFTTGIQENFKKETNLFGKVAYIAAMAKDPYNYRILIQIYQENKEPLIKSAAIDGLADILKNPLFFKAFGNNFGRVKSDILEILVNGISSGDVAQMSKSSAVLKEEKLQWNYWIKDFAFFDEAIQKLTLPRDIETYNDLMSCKAFLKNEKYTPQKPAYNHPIPWEFLNTQVGDSSIAAVKTTKGLIRIQLFKHSAPGSVANFVRLIQDKFYSGKTFHRVVPNFVIQTGCPRGDGYGSLDYTIRSELPPMYYDKEGFVGMASSGLHTEGTQWFITHSPAPHLDGKYTIFGKVIEGMDVVHNITQGDKINEIIFVK